VLGIFVISGVPKIGNIGATSGNFTILMAVGFQVLGQKILLTLVD
jgi:hypothetical protein